MGSIPTSPTSKRPVSQLVTAALLQSAFERFDPFTGYYHASMAGMADAGDLKSLVPKRTCGFESHCWH